MSLDLKNESDVKEYLENLGIEYRFGCYSEKKADGKLQAVEKHYTTHSALPIRRQNFTSS